MPNMDDFYAFKSTSGGDDGAGCLSPAAVAFFLIIAFIYLMVKIFN
ncbi:MAG: hypothetical protein ACI4RV_05145 [Eubacteriales bacterium]